ncbi:MAG: hypothetical protein JNJ88_06125 [Planctomycetes bacterium]|nr:hypothetical protein [Planctomycetota bacterium]
MDPLRPRDFGQLLDAAFRLAFQRFGLFVKLHVALALLAYGGMAVGVAPLVAGFVMESWPLIAAGAVVAFLALVLVLWVSGVFVGAIQHAIGKEAIGEHANFRESLRVGRERPWSVLFAEVMAQIGAFLCCFGIFLSIAHFWMAAPVVVLEGSAGTAALERSSQLTAGRRWHAIGLWFLMSFIAFSVMGPITFPMMFFLDYLQRNHSAETYLAATILQQVVSTGGGFVFGLFTRCAQTLFYLDLRVRKEGLDLQIGHRSAEATAVG